jgi:Domain of unknown function (DUF4124)
MLAMALALTANAAHAAHKCVGADGRVVYSDTPCATDAKQSEVYGTQPRQANRGAAPTWQENRGAAPTRAGLGKKREKLALTPSTAQVGECVEAWRPSMRDPHSLYALGSTMQRVTNLERPDVKPWNEVVLDARSKNGFGGYNAIRLLCPLSQDGSLDAKTMEAYKALRTLGIEPD